MISATDDGGKAVWTNEFRISVYSVNDYPYLVYDLPTMETQEGLDSMVIEYEASTGRDTAMGKISFLMDGNGIPYFEDIENDEIFVDFALLDGDMNEAELAISDEQGFRIYYGEGQECTLYVLPPQYTDDPENYVVLFGSHKTMNTDDSPYYLRVYASDDPNDLRSQNNYTIPITVHPVNDPPRLVTLPDVTLNEDTSFTSQVPFIETYASDIDNSTEDLTVDFFPEHDEVSVRLNEDGLLHVDLSRDFSEITEVTVVLSDGVNEITSSFRVLIKPINDRPTINVNNIYNDMIINDLFWVRGSADDVEKTLRGVEVALVPEDVELTGESWVEAKGTFVWQYLLDIRELTDGTYELHLRSYDGREYSEELVYDIQVESIKPVIDPNRPTVSITSDLSGVKSDMLEVTGEASDDSGYIERVEYRIDGSTWERANFADGMWNAIVNTRKLTNDIHNFSVRSYDRKSYSEIVFRNFEVENEDSDMDGIPNNKELELLMDPFNELDGAMDYDNDGYSNAMELTGYDKPYDPFDQNSHPPEFDDEEPFMDRTLLWVIVIAVIAVVLIIGLFLMNIRMDSNIHLWKDDLSRMRSQKRPKTLLQRIVEIAPMWSSRVEQAGPALPGGDERGESYEALPSAEETVPEEQQNT